MSDYVLELRNVVVERQTEPTGLFGIWGRKPIRALDGVDLSVRKGETLGIVGGSGAGKSTLLKAATLRLPVDRGKVIINGHDLTKAGGETKRKAMRRMPIISQDPREDLEMERPIGKQLVTGLKEAGLPDAEQRVATAFATVGLTGLDHRTPRELSGGQIQRAVIARALAANPALLACDEPFSGVDVHLQLELAGLLKELQRTQGITILLVSHNLQLIRRMSDRVAVFFRGRLFELAEPDAILADPKHPYSQTFLRRSSGQMPPEDDPTVLLGGCPWFAYCKQSVARCRTEVPMLREVEAGRLAACHEL